MNYEEGVFREAFVLYQALIKYKEIDKKKHNELYRTYFSPKVREVIQNVIQPDAKVRIFQLDETIYMVPEIDNEVLTYTNEELRNVMKLSTNKELYMAQFIWINVLSEFYGDQFQYTNESRTYVKVEEILRNVEEYIKQFKEIDEEELADLSALYDMDLEGMIEVWDGLRSMTEDLTDVRRATKRDYGFLLKVLSFWENERLLIIHNNEEIVLTEKMKNISAHYYHHEERINRIKELLNKVEDLVSKKEGGE
ncbi:DUF6063 family protein [Bacillus sp. m3-13]|uniref:DUF6063 family protein n=1 Tax=Bacillus sp. m3-13 TaxID=406124 RepID=UPI0001E89DAB|nr:DUF6063 family protein [Bacillus sp. m3-13]